MKKTLSVILATLMLLGMFAVSTSAFSRPDFPLTEINETATAELLAFPAPVSAQDEGGDTFSADLKAFQTEAIDLANQKLFASQAGVILTELQFIPTAYKDGKTLPDFAAAATALDISNSPESKAIDAFLANETERRADHANGSLKNKLISLYIIAVDQRIAVLENLAKEFFTADALAYAAANSAYYQLNVTLSNANLTQKEYNEISKIMNLIVSPFVVSRISTELQNGNFKEAAKLVNDIVSEMEKVFADYGIGAARPSFWQKLWNFILKWIFFGWIWM